MSDLSEVLLLQRCLLETARATYALDALPCSKDSSMPVQLLAMKKSPDDILKLFNQQPQNALFAGSPAQVRLSHLTTVQAATAVGLSHCCDYT